MSLKINTNTQCSNNFICQSSVKKKSKNKAMIIAGTMLAGGALFALSYKGMLGIKLQGVAQNTVSKIKTFYKNTKTKNSTNALQIRQPESLVVIKNIDGLERIRTITSDLYRKGNNLNLEMYSVASGKDGLIKTFSELYKKVEYSIDISNDVVEIMSQGNKLENLLLDYNRIMQENNSLVLKYNCGDMLTEPFQKEIYLNLIQKARQIEDIAQYDEYGVIIFNSKLKKLISSWIN